MMMNPPPVTKSLSKLQEGFCCAMAESAVNSSTAPAMNTAPAIKLNRIVVPIPKRMIIPPLLNGRGGGPEDHVRDTVDDKMQGVNDDAARGGRLLVDHELPPRKGDRLVRIAAHGNGRAVEREIAENRAAGCAARSRLGLSQYCIGADAGRADAKDQAAERSLRGNPVGQADRGRVKRLRAEQRRDAAT